MWRIILLFFPSVLMAQITAEEEMWLEQWVESNEEGLLQQIDQADLPFSSIYLNTITEEQLQALSSLSKEQIHSFLEYREEFGPFLAVEELRAVPLFDRSTIQQIQSLLVLDPPSKISSSLWNTPSIGSRRQTSIRVGRTFPKKLGYLHPGVYRGNPLALTGKFTLDWPGQFKLGVAFDKDAGESWPFHFNKHMVIDRPFKYINLLVLGDYQFQLGQGLIGGQSFGSGLSFTPSLLVKGRAHIRPKRGSTEGNYQSGLGIKWSRKNSMGLAFISMRNRNGNLQYDSIQGFHVTSINQAGLTRTPNEIENRNTIKHLLGGFNWTFNLKNGFVGFNSTFHRFTRPILPIQRPYNQYLFTGSQLLNISVNFQFHIQGHLWFAETAIDHHFNQAHLLGWLLSPAKNLDFVLSFRNYSPTYQSFETRTFGRFGKAHNENGIFFLMKYQPHPDWEISFYNDIRKFPWMRYNVHAPSIGTSLRMRVQYAQKNTIQLYADLRTEKSTVNLSSNSKFKSLSFQQKSNFRIQMTLYPNSSLEWRIRLESAYLSGHPSKQTGQLVAQDFILKPPQKPFDFKLRLTLFDIPNYNLRIYQYEHQLAGFFGMPAFFGRGISWYFIPRWKTSRSLLEARISRMYQPDVQSLGSQWESVEGKTRIDFGLQFTYHW